MRTLNKSGKFVRGSCHTILMGIQPSEGEWASLAGRGHGSEHVNRKDKGQAKNRGEGREKSHFGITGTACLRTSRAAGREGALNCLESCRDKKKEASEKTGRRGKRAAKQKVKFRESLPRA